MKNIAILGSTGSIGVNTLDVIRALDGRYRVVALAADSNIKLLAEQSRRFRPSVVSIGSQTRLIEARRAVPSKTKVLFGPDGLLEIVKRPDIDMVVFAISGTACLAPLVSAITHKKEVALANKESLVSAGGILMPLARRHGVTIIPIDSEHSAIFQCLHGARARPSRILLTASGGPLRSIPKTKFDRLSRDFILRHPKWSMGKKISVDSATMMNKGLEIIEACHLFNVNEKMIDVVIHPEAVMHSMVEFVDGSVLGEMSNPDMRLPIQYALTYPERQPSAVKSVDFYRLRHLSFERPDNRKFPCLGLARQAMRSGGVSPAILNAADEESVRQYLDGRIRFSKIPEIIGKVLSRQKRCLCKAPALADIFKAEAWAKEEARVLCYR